MGGFIAIHVPAVNEQCASIVESTVKPILSGVTLAFELNSLLFAAHPVAEYSLVFFRREVRNITPLTVAIIRLRKSLMRITFR
jgi:hypothetical protein